MLVKTRAAELTAVHIIITATNSSTPLCSFCVSEVAFEDIDGYLRCIF